MKFKNLTVLSIASCLTLGQAFAEAGGGSGNGGDAVVCRGSSNSIQSAELLDYFEGRTLRNLAPLAAAGLSDAEYVARLDATLKAYDAKAFKGFKAEALKVLSAIKNFRTTGQSGDDEILFTEQPLNDVSDSGRLLLNAECSVEQLAVRTAQEFPDDPKYIIQAHIVRALPELHVRGLALHEAIYKVFADAYGAQNSVAARYLHQKLTSRVGGEIVFADFAAAVKLVPTAVFTKTTPSGREIELQTEGEVLPDGSVVAYQETAYSWNGRPGLRLIVGADGVLDLALSRQHGGIVSPAGVGSRNGSVREGMLTQVEVNGAPVETYYPYGAWRAHLSLDPARDGQLSLIGVRLFADWSGNMVEWLVPATTGPGVYVLEFNVALDADFNVVVSP